MRAVIRNERIVPVDVDDTLVMHGFDKDIPGARYVEVEDHCFKGRYICMRVNEPMVRLVHEELSRGAQVIVWSRSGYKHAENVLEALGINHANILIMTKPHVYFDDTEVQNWLKDRVYIGPDSPYKV